MHGRIMRATENSRERRHGQKSAPSPRVPSYLRKRKKKRRKKKRSAAPIAPTAMGSLLRKRHRERGFMLGRRRPRCTKGARDPRQKCHLSPDQGRATTKMKKKKKLHRLAATPLPLDHARTRTFQSPSSAHHCSGTYKTCTTLLHISPRPPSLDRTSHPLPSRHLL